MTNTLLDFSRRPELALHARVIADVEAAAAAVGIAPLIAGAFARDLHLLYRHGINVQRKTEDIDFALAVTNWAGFAALHERLTASGASRRWQAGLIADRDEFQRPRPRTGLA